MGGPNPYQSPEKSELSTIEQQPRFNASKTAAMYLKSLVVLLVISMGILSLTERRFDLTWAPILLVSHYIEKRNQNARWLLITIFSFLIGVFWFGVLLVILGVTELTASIAGWNFQIHTPMQMILIAAAFSAILGIPVCLLCTREAKLEFGVSNESE